VSDAAPRGIKEADKVFCILKMAALSQRQQNFCEILCKLDVWNCSAQKL
jgi:hypothetical protein